MIQEFLKSCEENDLSSVRLLLLEGVNVNSRRGMTGLHYVVKENHYGELLELLLTQSGVNVNIYSKDKHTPLMVACEMGHVNIVRRLSQVPDIQYNCRDLNDRTALHQAVYRNKPRCVEVLRGAGASVDWNVRANTGDYPLTLAIHLG